MQIKEIRTCGLFLCLLHLAALLFVFAESKIWRSRDNAPCEQSFLLSSWVSRRKGLRQTFEIAAAQTAGLVNLLLSRQTIFSGCEPLFIDKPVVITELNPV